MSVLKLALAVVLLPACLSGFVTLSRLLAQASQAEFFWVASLTGAACWLTVYLCLPKPMRAYVFGHELTHALWTWFFGGRVKKFRANAKGGRVVATKTNFLIELAPYFFPLYAILAALLFLAAGNFWNGLVYRVIFHLIVGAAYAFHLSLTWHILKIRQPDIVRQGYLFSAVVILLGNLLVLLIAIPLLTGQPEPSTVLAWWIQATGALFARLARLGQY